MHAIINTNTLETIYMHPSWQYCTAILEDKLEKLGGYRNYCVIKL